MDVRGRWPAVDALCRSAEVIEDIEMWLFGSALSSDRPNDLDVLIIYWDRLALIRLRESYLWEISIPPVDMIAMTSDEEIHYGFIEGTGAIRLVPRC